MQVAAKYNHSSEFYSHKPRVPLYQYTYTAETRKYQLDVHLDDAAFVRVSYRGETTAQDPVSSPDLPRIHIEVLLREQGRDDRPIRKLPSGQSAQRLLRTLVRIVLDEDLADAGRRPTWAGRPRDLQVEDRAVLGAFLLDIFFDFWKRGVSKFRSPIVRETWKGQKGGGIPS